ncbi:MAG: FAD-dependent oxidoreductase [Pyrinomonadaceae bacterium]|nr:FAD-dependent oxidoreductase [Pyrinomonadaceae bacterium]
MSESYDFIVIGGGSAGLVAAGGSATLGAKVALIEKRALGGDCLYTGCVPSKTLIRSARFAAELERAETFGFETVANVKFKNDSFASVTNRVQNVIKTIEIKDSPAAFEKMGVEVILGSARFLNPHEIEVSLKDSGEKRVMKARRFCIATGSSATIPNIEGLRETGFITNDNVFELKELPRKLVVIGGGAIGLEIGQSFARFGSRVTVIESGKRILSKEDEEVSDFMTKTFRAENIEILTETKIIKTRISDNVKFVTIEHNGERRDIETDEILVATGRKPNLEGLDLEKANVKFDAKRIETNEFLQTSTKHIFAAGDVTNHFQFTHTADYEAQVVIQNAFLFFGLRKKIDFRVVPWATFTEPEIARVGLTEKEARAKYGDKVKIYHANFDENDRAQAEDKTTGFAKIICVGKKTVGTHIVGANAGDLIHEFIVAMKHNLSVAQMNEAIHIYPTLSKITQQIGTEQTLETLKSPLVQKLFAFYMKFWR